jgi:uncharacterized BrkB/YihY/UPF0761 family membrane protein
VSAATREPQEKTAIDDTLPGRAAGILSQALQSGQQGVGGGFWALVSGIAVALWSASSGTAAAQEGSLWGHRSRTGWRREAGSRTSGRWSDGSLARRRSWPSSPFTTCWAPNRKVPNWRCVLPGAVLATALWAVASLGISFYISSFGQTSFAETYGALAGMVILVLWLFVSALALMVGGELNASLERRREQILLTSSLDVCVLD